MSILLGCKAGTSSNAGLSISIVSQAGHASRKVNVCNVICSLKVAIQLQLFNWSPNVNVL